MYPSNNKGPNLIGSVDLIANKISLVDNGNNIDITDLFNSKANLNSPSFTGIVSGISKGMVGLSQVDNVSDINKPVSSAQASYINTAVANLVAAAPTTLDTLNELAIALGNDPNFATTITNQIALKAPINNASFTGTTSGITASMVGLGNVNNTSDANKPISTA